MASAKPVVCIVTPGTRSANNGNWRTAARWAALLRERFRVIVQSECDGAGAHVVIALHARRSAPSVARCRERSPRGPLAVVLTGTDLYRDLPGDAQARASLDAADRVVVLQEDALRILEPRWRAKAQVICQSATPLAPRRKASGRLDCVVVGHLRPEKDPLTLFAAIEQLPAELRVRVRHIGAPLDEGLAAAARALAAREPRYHANGALPHGLARAAIAAAHVLVHPSRMEGGANVIAEAVAAGTPVIASRISGNVGMLGTQYPGYFPPGDAPALAACLTRAAREPAYLEQLRSACEARRPLFAPDAERSALQSLVDALLAPAGG